MSRRPHRSTVDLMSALTAASSETSTAIESGCPPSFSSSRTAAADFVWLRAATTTRAPAPARPRAMPRPIPPLPPVTIATFPLRSNIGPLRTRMLPEVVRRDVVAEGGKTPGPDRAHRDDAVLLLRDPVDEEIRLGYQRHAMAREDRRRHDHIRDARLILEREKDEPLRGARTLADDDAARHLDSGAVLDARELARAQHAPVPERRASQRHRVAAERHARAGVVGGEALDVRHLAQRAGLARRVHEQRSGGRHGRRPEICPPGPPERRQRADGRERFQLVALEVGPAGEVVDGAERRFLP